MVDLNMLLESLQHKKIKITPEEKRSLLKKREHILESLT